MPNILPGQTTLGIMRGLVATEADQPTPTEFTNVTIPNYNDFLNRSYREVTGLLVDSFQDYYVNPDSGNPFTFTTDGTAYLYDLPNDFWKLLGMDCFWQPGNLQTATTMREFMKLERNQFQNYSGAGLAIPQYKISGNQVWLQPMPPAANLQILVRYVPLLPDMVDVGTITFDGIQNSGDSIFIASQSTLPQGVAGVLDALASEIQYVAIENGETPVDVPGRIEYEIGATNTETAANFAAAMNRGFTDAVIHVPWSTYSTAQDQTVATVTASGPVVSIRLKAALAIVWSTEDSNEAELPAVSIALDPLPVATQANPYGAWRNFASSLNGADELVIVDTAIKVMGKQQQGTELLRARKAELLQRMRTEFNNRNAAQNGRVTNTRRLRRGWGPWGSGGIGRG